MMNQMLELSDNDFKAAVVKMLQFAIANTFEKNEKIENSPKKENIQKRTKWNNQNKNAVYELNNRMNMIENRISEPEDRTIEITQSGQQSK